MHVTAQKKNSPLLEKLIAAKPQWFDSLLAKRNDLNIQVIYTQIDRDKKGKATFTDHFFNVDDSRYYYPASTIKLPIAILALQRLNELKVKGLDKNTTMITAASGHRQTEVCNDPTTADGRPTIAHYIKKILLVSDNDASNRLYEFLGQEYINTTLQKMGYNNVQIVHRLSISLTEEENRQANPIEFIDSLGRPIYVKPAVRSNLVYAKRSTKLGKGFYQGGKLVNEPFDFSIKNRFTLTELHSIVRSIMFPESVPIKKRFNLTKDDYDFLRLYMSMMPEESTFPFYDKKENWDTYVKFLYYGSESGKSEPNIRIFNKVGDAYGFLIDGAYLADYKNGVEFLLSAIIYCNSDGIFNDDKYDYDSVGFPFMKHIGQTIYEYERTRVRKVKPDFSTILFNYQK
jgi:hypothetical protein